MASDSEIATSSRLRLAAASFFLDRESARCTIATLVWYRKYIGALVDWLEGQGITTPAGVTADTMRSYLVSLQRRNLAARTIHHHASAARTFFNFLVAEGDLPVSPMARIKMPRQDQTMLPYLSTDDAKKILAACGNHRDVAIVLCLLDTGCRAQEFVDLDIGDVDLQTGSVRVRNGKGRKERMAYLGNRARKALVRYLGQRATTPPSEPLWLSGQTGERLTYNGLRLLLYRLGRRSGVANCHAHSFRRTFAVWSLQAGMNVHALRLIMGHSDLTVLQRYLDLTEHDLGQAHHKHGAVDSKL